MILMLQIIAKVSSGNGFSGVRTDHSADCATTAAPTVKYFRMLFFSKTSPYLVFLGITFILFNISFIPRAYLSQRLFLTLPTH